MVMTLCTRYSSRMIRLLNICRTTVAVCLTLVALNANATSDAYRTVRVEFQRAYAQAQLTATPLEPDSDALRAYPLYSYVQAARLRTALEDAGAELTDVDQRAETFIAEYGGEPVGRDVQRAWLASLSERMLWQTFLLHYPAGTSDAALQCYSYSARIALNQTANLVEDIRARWLTPKSLPECERAFEWLRAQNGLPAELIEQRARLALKDNNFRFAREIAAQLPPERAGAVLQWAALLEHPQRQIDHLIANPKFAVEPEALLAGWTRLARIDRDGAKRRFEILIRTRKLNETAASPYALALALPLAWDRRTDSLDYFARVQSADLDDTALEWHTRAALWAQDWDLVSKTIASMSDTSRGLARWRYWAGRAAERLGDDKLARQLFESLLIDDNFYSMMAAARLERALIPNPEKLVVDDVQLAQIQQLPELVRARELLLSSLQPLANTEWAAGMGRLSEDARKQAIHLAARWGWYQQAIATATQARVFNDY